MSTSARPSTAAPSTQQHATIAANACYWGVLDLRSPAETARAAASSPRRAAALVAAGSPVLEALLEPLVPVPIDTLDAAYVPIDEHRVLACAAARELVDDYAAGSLLTLTPDALPADVTKHLPATADARHARRELNLLTGPRLPRPVRALRRQAAWLAAAALLAAGALALVGIERRSAAAQQTTASLDAATTALVTQTLAGPADISAEDAAFRLHTDIARLRQTRAHPPAGPAQEIDAPEALADLLAHWPVNVRTRTESLIVAPAGLTLAVDLESAEGASRLIDGLKGVPGYTLQQPQLSNAAKGVSRVNLRLVPTPASPAASTASSARSTP